MLSARQLLLVRRARDRAIGVAIAPLGTAFLLPDPDFRRRVFRCVGHVVARSSWRVDKVANVDCPAVGLGVVTSCGGCLTRASKECRPFIPGGPREADRSGSSFASLKRPE